jgi:hypothetical protein
MGYTLLMRVQMTEVYRGWINSLKDRSGHARVQVRKASILLANNL